MGLITELTAVGVFCLLFGIFCCVCLFSYKRWERMGDDCTCRFCPKCCCRFWETGKVDCERDCIRCVRMASGCRSLLYRLYRCLSSPCRLRRAKTLEAAQAKALETFQNLVDKTWKDESNIGYDATGLIRLNHRGIRVKKVYQIKKRSFSRTYKKRRAHYKAAVRQNGEYLKVEDMNATYGRKILTEGASEKCDPTINEFLLFHGTPKENTQGIMDNGLSLDKAREGLYGKAIYMAESAQKADQYADKGVPRNRRMTDLTMFVVRVTLGRSYIHEKEEPLQGLPCTKKGCMQPNCEQHKERFDSVVAGTKKRFREFLVFDDKICLPSFLLIYDRVM